MSRNDRLAIAFLVFTLCAAMTVELYWFTYRDELVARAESEWIARLFRIYGDADRGIYDQVTPMAVGQEAINIFVTQLLNVWLIVAIVARKRYRDILQLGLGAYVVYSVVLYYASAHLTGYPDMRYRSLWTFGLFYGANAPWLVGYGALAWGALRGLGRGLRGEVDPV